MKWLENPAFAENFIENGFSVVPVAEEKALTEIRSRLVTGLRAAMPGGDGLDDDAYLNHFHEFADMSQLNEVRVRVHREVCAAEDFRHLVFRSVRKYLVDLIGNEMVMQRQVNFVAQMPKDPTALLYLHTDVWAGNSPYEVILWLPLVSVYETKSMYICDRKNSWKYLNEFKQGLKLESTAKLLEKIRPDLQQLKMSFGEALLFSPTLFHGSEENKTQETRFILNVRFKSLFSPYGAKALGETFTPVNYLPATEIGLTYETDFGATHG